jgi:hypothetical protein
MPPKEYRGRNLAPGAIEGTNHGINDYVHKLRAIQAWRKLSEILPDDAFADDVVPCEDNRPYKRRFSCQ